MVPLSGRDNLLMLMSAQGCCICLLLFKWPLCLSRRYAGLLLPSGPSSASSWHHLFGHSDEGWAHTTHFLIKYHNLCVTYALIKLLAEVISAFASLVALYQDYFSHQELEIISWIYPMYELTGLPVFRFFRIIKLRKNLFGTCQFLYWPLINYEELKCS